jgi:hypothetical protein
MNINRLINELRSHPELGLRIVLPDGSAVAAHFHITELGLLTKDFFDCGGTRRQLRAWSLQAWVAEDLEHRLTPRKLLRILELHKDLGGPADLPVSVEYQGQTLETYQLAAAAVGGGAIELRLEPVQTACLALETCILPENVPALGGSGCCAPGCC